MAEINPYPSGFTTIPARKSSRPTIAVFRSNFVGNFNVLQWNGLINAAKKMDVNLICYLGGLLHSWHGTENASTVIYKLVDTKILDGIMIWSGNINWNTRPQDLEKFVKSYTSLPVVSVEVAVDGVPSLVWNDFEGMSGVISHLIEIHHCNHIAFIRGNVEQPCMEQRYQAYLHTLDKYKIPFDPSLVWSNSLFYNGPKALQVIVDKLTATNIDAVAACNDDIAKMLVKLLKVNGLPFLPVVGFDDEYEGRAGRSALTTVRAPFYEIGYRAVEVLLQMIEGRPVNSLEFLPCSMIVRRSCGCGSPALLKASETLSAISSESIATEDGFTNVDGSKFEKIANNLVHFSTVTDPEWAKKLLTVFLEEVQGTGDNIFIPYLETLFDKVVMNGDETDIWQGIILNLHICATPFIQRNGFDLVKAENLLLKAMMLIAETAIDFQKYAQIQKNNSLITVHRISRIFSDVSDIDTLLDKIAGDLAQLGIRSGYLALYEKPGTYTEQARLILAYDADGRKVLDPENATFPSKQLLPDGILPSNERYKYILNSLVCQNRQIGFALFEASLNDLPIYEFVSSTISASLNGLLMVGELENQAVELSKANIDLENAYQSMQENQQKLLIAEKMASLGRLTAGIAHEMNTPLAAVRTSIKELSELVNEYKQSIENPQVLPEDHLAIAEDMAKYLKTAEKAAEKSAGFIRGIKAQTFDMKFTNFQLFNAALVISDALRILEFAIEKGHCELVTEIDNSIRLCGDPRQLVQVITNLVTNSIDACKPDGGTITVKLQCANSGFAELLVEDTGCGIPEEIITKVFDPMFTTKPFGEGTGLGLSIVHDLVNEYHGSINIKSQKGFTAFTIMLPLQKEK